MLTGKLSQKGDDAEVNLTQVLMWLILMAAVVALSHFDKSMAGQVFTVGALYLFGGPPGKGKSTSRDKGSSRSSERQ